jgi:hypothetical protein
MDQAASHWREFSVIIASGSLGLAIVVAGLLWTSSADIGTRVLIAGLLSASIAAFALAYYSIQVGAVLLYGELTFWEVAASFVIAGSQLAMPLWLGHVLRRHPEVDTVTEVLPAAGHWFALYACFTAAGTFANKYEARRRARVRLLGELAADFETSQRIDRRASAASALLAAGIWQASLRGGLAWWAAASLAYFAAGVMVATLMNQSRAVRRLAGKLGLADGL